MISECMNPSCRKELRYLRDGRVVRIVKNHGDPVNVEHFWLCGRCYAAFDFHFTQEGAISMIPRPARATKAPARPSRPYVLTLVA